MRVNREMGNDPELYRLAQELNVYFDGQHLTTCFEADDDEGWVICAAGDDKTPYWAAESNPPPKPEAFDHYGIWSEKRYGRVELEDGGSGAIEKMRQRIKEIA